MLCKCSKFHCINLLSPWVSVDLFQMEWPDDNELVEPAAVINVDVTAHKPSLKISPIRAFFSTFNENTCVVVRQSKSILKPLKRKFIIFISKCFPIVTLHSEDILLVTASLAAVCIRPLFFTKSMQDLPVLFLFCSCSDMFVLYLYL